MGDGDKLHGEEVVRLTKRVRNTDNAVRAFAPDRQPLEAWGMRIGCHKPTGIDHR